MFPSPRCVPGRGTTPPSSRAQQSARAVRLRCDRGPPFLPPPRQRRRTATESDAFSRAHHLSIIAGTHVALTLVFSASVSTRHTDASRRAASSTGCPRRPDTFDFARSVSACLRVDLVRRKRIPRKLWRANAGQHSRRHFFDLLTFFYFFIWGVLYRQFFLKIDICGYLF